MKKKKIEILEIGNRVKIAGTNLIGKVLGNSRKDKNIIIVELDKTFDVVQKQNTELELLPSELNVPEFSDMDNKLSVWLETITGLIEMHGSNSELYVDAGYNNVNFKLRLK